jgi:hypothetical protein
VHACVCVCVCVCVFASLIQVGEEFCGGKSETLEESIRKQSLNYFRSYHRTRLDELKMFLENEGWELCPVKSSFTIFMLQVQSSNSNNNNNSNNHIYIQRHNANAIKALDRQMCVRGDRPLVS